jgi:hypothetical protein
MKAMRETDLGLDGTTPPNGWPAPTRWRRAAIIVLKLVHSAIFLVNSAAVLHIFFAGVRNRPSRWTGLALVAAGTESVVFVVNRGRCPLTGMVEALGAKSGRVSDIFLPRSLADRIPQLCTPPLLIGVTALIVNAWRRWEGRPLSTASRHGVDMVPASAVAGRCAATARLAMRHPLNDERSGVVACRRATQPIDEFDIAPLGRTRSRSTMFKKLVSRRYATAMAGEARWAAS